jgi:conjugal transfer pilus assembly protein TrbC
MRKIESQKIYKRFFNLYFIFFAFFSSIICEISFSHQALAVDKPLQPTKILIFVSSSMPETSLIQWMQEARELTPHAALIMRGFVHDSLPATRDFVGQLVKESHGEGGVSIDPALFKKYDIKEVPAVVVEIVNPGNSSNSKFDVVYGNTSLTEAMQVISEKGDTAENIKQLMIDNRKDEHIGDSND